jgi:hypothetical protein
VIVTARGALALVLLVSCGADVPAREPSALGGSVGSTISRPSIDASKGTIRAIGVSPS